MKILVALSETELDILILYQRKTLCTSNSDIDESKAWYMKIWALHNPPPIEHNISTLILTAPGPSVSFHYA